VSGEAIVLGGDDEGAARLVRAAAHLARADLGPHALVGGLAVMCRLAAVHRATSDVDTVAETTAPTAVEVIASSIGTIDPSNPNRVLIDDIRVDVIDTARFAADDLEGLTTDERLIIVSHRWALDMATPATIAAGRDAASIRVATPAALVAMKAGAVLGGRTRDPRKRASDLYDLYRLALAHDRGGQVAGELASAPFGLGRLVAEALREVVGQPERAVRTLASAGPEAGAVTADDIADVLGPLVAHLAG
jgi:hypothetical protein